MVAVPVIVLVPDALAEDVTVSVAVVEAPLASVTDEVPHVPVQPDATVLPSVNLSSVQPMLLFVMVAV